MSEADTQNNQPLPEPGASNDDITPEFSDVMNTGENLKIVKFSELPDLKPPVQPWKPDETLELVDDTIALLTSSEIDDTTSETSDASGQKSTQDADWFALAQKMRQRNRRLLDQVSQLKTLLQQKQEALHSEITRSQQRETQLTQQTEELNTLHEQLGRLFNALESSHQASGRQQILIETLSEQLQSGQERIAQLERECAFTQQRYNEQSHQLLQSANTCRELRTRLQRQQRQTLQFKAALEKSLEMPTTITDTQQLQRSANVAPGFAPKAQPIQPWSAESGLIEDDLSNLDSLWKNPVRLEPLQPVYFSKTEPFEVRRVEELEFSATAESSNLAENAIAASEASNATELELEQQLLAEMSSLAEAAGLSTVASDATAMLEANLDESNEPIPMLPEAEDAYIPEVVSSAPETQPEPPSESSWADSANPEPAEPPVTLPQANWPSPTLYPLRAPKKRKSLAAIELPSFPRFYPS